MAVETWERVDPVDALLIAEQLNERYSWQFRAGSPELLALINSELRHAGYRLVNSRYERDGRQLVADGAERLVDG